MKALTLYNPHATLMMLGEKNIETRSWPTGYRGPLGIHVARRMPPEYRECCRAPVFREALGRHDLTPQAFGEADSPGAGCMICIRNLIDMIPTAHLTGEIKSKRREQYPLSTQEQAFGDYSYGRWAWIFDNRILILRIPHEIKGHQQLWNWDEQTWRAINGPHIEKRAIEQVDWRPV